MRNYEIMYILDPSLDEKGVKNNYDNIINLFQKDSQILSSQEPELKSLSYLINNFSKGFYVSLFVEANNDIIAEFNRIANINESIIRFIVLKKGSKKIDDK